MGTHTTIDGNDMLVSTTKGADAVYPGASLDATATATSGGVFALGQTGAWTVQASSGNGGNGLQPDPDYFGEPGQTGGSSGVARASMSGWQFGPFDSATIAIGARSGNGGNGGDGGYSNDPEGLNQGGYGGDGGTAAAAVVQVQDLAFTAITSLALDLSATGGRGGWGGLDAYFDPFGTGRGAGGDGGVASISLASSRFALGNGAASTLTIDAQANGGRAGIFGDHGGAASISVTALHVRGGAENDTVQFGLVATGGPGGDVDGSSSVGFADNSLTGGGGINTLSFTENFLGGGNATADALTIDLAGGTIVLHDAGAGDSTSTFHNFRNVYGGGGNNVIGGGAGGDTLTGGGGNDVFLYRGAADSTGVGHDVITDLDFAHDKLDLPGVVTGIDAGVSGAINGASFDGDLSTLLGTTHLAAGHAVLVTANGGDLSGHLFLVVDGNGQVGYQSGADYVIDVTGATHVPGFSVATFV